MYVCVYTCMDVLTCAYINIWAREDTSVACSRGACTALQHHNRQAMNESQGVKYPDEINSKKGGYS